MNNWPALRLEDVCERVTVGHVGKMADQYRDDGVPFLRSQDVLPFQIRRSDLKFIGRAFADRLRKSELRAGDVVVVRTGYPGVAAVVPAELSGANCADLVVISPGPKVDPFFLASLFNSRWGRDAVAGRLVGVAQQHFNISAAKRLEVRLPPVELQRRIVSVLAALTEVADANECRITILEEMVQALYREWFVWFRFPGHESVQLIDSEFGRIPEGWQTTTLGAAADLDRLNMRPDRFPGELFAHLSVPAFDESRRARLEPCAEIRSGKYLVVAPAVLISKLNPRFPRVWAVTPHQDLRTITSTEFLVLRARTVPAGFLYHVLLSDEFRDQFIGLALGTSTSHQRVKPQDALAIRFVEPPRGLTQQFDSAASTVLKLTDALREWNVGLIQIRDLLLPKLVSGEIDISQLDLDELMELGA